MPGRAVTATKTEKAGPAVRPVPRNGGHRRKPREDPELADIKPLAVTVSVAARLLGIARCTVYKLMDREELEWFPVGVGRRIAVAEIESYMKRNAVRGRRVA